ncbi:MAG: hypothetical protein MCS20_02195, partial [Candidatus Phytoplasma mali]|nr:hypothetical protein [Candidatus Phytoplasma mali]
TIFSNAFTMTSYFSIEILFYKYHILFFSFGVFAFCDFYIYIYIYIYIYMFVCIYKKRYIIFITLH